MACFASESRFIIVMDVTLLSLRFKMNTLVILNKLKTSIFS